MLSLTKSGRQLRVKLPALRTLFHAIHYFNRMLSGFAFLPNLKVNILEIIRLAHFFKARLQVLQFGEKTTSKEQRFKEIPDRGEYNDMEIDIHWPQGALISIINGTCEYLGIPRLSMGPGN